MSPSAARNMRALPLGCGQEPAWEKEEPAFAGFSLASQYRKGIGNPPKSKFPLTLRHQEFRKPELSHL